MNEIRNHEVVEPNADDYEDGEEPPSLACRKCGLGADDEARFETVTCSGASANGGEA